VRVDSASPSITVRVDGPTHPSTLSTSKYEDSTCSLSHVGSELDMIMEGGLARVEQGKCPWARPPANLLQASDHFHFALTLSMICLSVLMTSTFRLSAMIECRVFSNRAWNCNEDGIQSSITSPSLPQASEKRRPVKTASQEAKRRCEWTRFHHIGNETCARNEAACLPPRLLAGPFSSEQGRACNLSAVPFKLFKAIAGLRTQS